MHALAERRTQRRQRVFKNAAILVTENSPKLECAVRDLSPQGVRLHLSTTYGIPHQFDVLIDGRRRRCRSIWRTYTDIGVMFLEATEPTANSLQHEVDIVPLIELLKMAAEKWPDSEAADVSDIELFQRDKMLLEMWPEACRRTGVTVHEFPIGVIRRWQQKMGWAN
ncbi:MAG TPA: PilZ domain-containing protein [Pseudolabrys sp.]|nr:PilZ domain-containing protein [Pseudolabrys sp.]